MNHKIYFIIYAFIFVICLTNIQAQEKYDKQIELIDTLLESNSVNNNQLNEDRLYLILTKLQLQNELISRFKYQIKQIDKEIRNYEISIQNFKSQIEKEKSEYAKLIRSLYRYHRTISKLSHIFLSDDYAKSYKRFKYLQWLSEYRLLKGKRIIYLKNKLEKEKSILELKKENKIELNHKLEKKTKELRKTSALKENHLNKIEQNHEVYRNTINEITRKQQELDDSLANDLLSLDLEEFYKKHSVDTVAYITKMFFAKRGNLSWPVKNGIIIKKFGEEQHPYFNDIKIRHNGIEISVKQNTAVYSVFNAYVSSIVNIPGLNTAIILKHGNYYTVYSNLTDVNIKKGETITKNTIIGYVSNNEKIAKLNFQIWFKKEKLNPILWLKKAP